MDQVLKSMKSRRRKKEEISMEEIDVIVPDLLDRMKQVFSPPFVYVIGVMDVTSFTGVCLRRQEPQGAEAGYPENAFAR